MAGTTTQGRNRQEDKPVIGTPKSCRAVTEAKVALADAKRCRISGPLGNIDGNLRPIYDTMSRNGSKQGPTDRELL